jgi:hypothetical protein
VSRAQGPRHIWIPDTQIKPGVKTDHVVWAARYIAEKKPQFIGVGGDWHDFPSLSSYDVGTSKARGRKIKADMEAGNEAAELFDATIRKHSSRSYHPRKVVFLGNHEARITRYVDTHPDAVEEMPSLDDLAWKSLGWVVYPFLQPVRVDGIVYCHYFPLGPNGAVTNSKRGAPSASAQVKRMMASCVAGHKQGFDYAEVPTPAGIKCGVIAGSFYQHDEEYLTPMGNTHWRGIVVLNDVRPDGSFDLCKVSLDYLKRRYG